tara:strand:- start:1368 stop:2309 length:942 start_codon:yes stop_codon:yes gene_type:complete
MMASESSSKSLQKQVNEICNQLHSEGTKVTVRRVLSLLPGVASTSTVHKYHKNWKDELDAGGQTLFDKLGFSHEFTTAFTKEITRFSVEAETRFRELAQFAEESRDSAIESLELAEEREKKQLAELEQVKKELKLLQDELVAIQKEAKVEFEKFQAASQASADGYRQQIDDLQKTEAEIRSSNETLRTELAKAQLKLEGNQDYVNEVKALNAALTEQIEQLRNENKEISRALASNESTGKGQEKLLAQLESSIGQEREVNRQLSKQLQRQESQQALDAKAIESLNEQLSVLQDKLAAEERRTKEQSAIIAKFT